MILDGIRVLELASHIAAPAAAGMLADWGAEVIKVEPATGDAIRWQFPGADPAVGSANFEFDNRGKRSIVLDYKNPEGRAVLEELIARTDILITNRLPGAMKRAGLDFETLFPRYPHLIYTSVTGYGHTGPGAEKGSFDLHSFWSRSGLSGQMFPPGTDHLNWRPGIGDHITAMAAALGTAVALIGRLRTGKGQLVESSLIRAGAYIGGFDLVEQLRHGKAFPPLSRTGEGARFSSTYQSVEGRWLCLWAQNMTEWHRLFAAVERPELAEDPRFASTEAISANGSALTSKLEEAIGTFSMTEIGRRLDEANLIWAPVLTAQEVVNDKFALAAGCFVDMADSLGGTMKSPAPPVHLSGGESAKGQAPTVGQHTREILSEIGLDQAIIAKMQAEGVVR